MLKQFKLVCVSTSVLNWLKDQPPLSEDQLKNLYITMEDFEVSIQNNLSVISLCNLHENCRF